MQSVTALLDSRWDAPTSRKPVMNSVSDLRSMRRQVQMNSIDCIRALKLILLGSAITTSAALSQISSPIRFDARPRSFALMPQA
jgi:hypothetical protein